MLRAERRAARRGAGSPSLPNARPTAAGPSPSADSAAAPGLTAPPGATGTAWEGSGVKVRDVSKTAQDSTAVAGRTRQKVRGQQLDICTVRHSFAACKHVGHTERLMGWKDNW